MHRLMQGVQFAAGTRVLQPHLQVHLAPEVRGLPDEALPGRIEGFVRRFRIVRSDFGERCLYRFAGIFKRDAEKVELIVDPVVDGKPALFAGLSGVSESSFRRVRIGVDLALSPGFAPWRRVAS
jgi:hypothetical protein